MWRRLLGAAVVSVAAPVGTHRWVVLIACSTVLMAAAPVATPGPSADQLRDRATQAYRRQDFAKACPLFAKAANADPSNAAIRADLGLCLQKQGKLDQAVEAHRGAFALATKSGDVAVRKSVEFNLHQLGYELRGDQFECSRRYFEDHFRFDQGGHASVDHADYGRWATSEARARFSEETLREPSEGPADDGKSVTVRLRAEQSGWTAGTCNLRLDECPTFEEARAQCSKAAGDAGPDAMEKCVLEVCQAAARKAQADCLQSLQRQSSFEEVCEVVADACLGKVHVTCKTNPRENGNDREPAPRVTEVDYRLPPMAPGGRADGGH